MFLDKLKGQPNVFAELVQSDHYRTVQNWAEANNVPTVATNNIHFADKEGYSKFQVLCAIRDNTTLDQADLGEITSSHYLKSAARMQTLFKENPTALKNSYLIAKQCSGYFIDLQFIFPEITGGQGESANKLLYEKVLNGIYNRYGMLSTEIQKRLDYEYEIIIQKHFASYFLVVADIVQQAPRTCGRGSAAASLVSYALGITHVDPVKYNFFFERFLNPGRIEPPDIDVDFPWDERDNILAYIFKKFGVENAAMIANHITFKARSCVREVAKVYGMPDEEISRITKKMSGIGQPDNLTYIIHSHPAFRNIKLVDPWPEILRTAETIRDYPRYLSVHCGGVVIAPDGLSRHVPLQPATRGLVFKREDQETLQTVSSSLEKDQKLYTIQWEKDQTEDYGLVKIDILGNRSLAVIRDSLTAVKTNYNIDIDYQTWSPLQDIATAELLGRGETMGVFYVESPAMRQLQIKTGAGDFEHLVIHSSIIRPAANEYVNEYIRRLKGGRFTYLHPSLKVLRETYGIMIYQEDVSRVVMAMADFTAHEADDLRKVISKKHQKKKLGDYRQKFFDNAQYRGVSVDICEKVWNMIMSFSGYSFCKPHSASYAMVSFKSAYLRAHYPAEFMAAVISNQGGYYSTFAYISESRRMELTVLMPDINHSLLEYHGKDRTIRVGFMQIKALKHESIRKIVNERHRNGLYRSFRDFTERTRLKSHDISLLIKSGCFDNLEPAYTRPQLLWMLKLNSKYKQNVSLFTARDLKEEVPPIKEFDEKTKLNHEIELFGMMISQHPLSLYQEQLGKLHLIPSDSFHKHINKPIRAAGWYITGKVTGTKHDRLMQFSSFEDLSGLYETTLFPKAFETFKHMLDKNRVFLLKGKVISHYGALSINVEAISYL
ncbi:MAG: DNA polymerase III subunit alpha [candidate division KSB1 bacterium]|nr:DNA polymerase III subunit alpha [candidate division KSB1 bacterium]